MPSKARLKVAPKRTAKPKRGRRETKSSRIEARLTPENLTVIKRAAELQGRSVSDFIVAAAQEAAHRTIEETHIIRLTVAQQRQIAEAILSPPEPTPALRRAFETHRRLFGQQRG